MASYLRPDNYDVYRTPLYQPNFDLITRVAAVSQGKYDRAVQSIQNTHNQALGLAESLSPYAQNKVNAYMDEANKKLRKVATLDFSKAENQAKAENLYAPIFSDPDISLNNAAEHYGRAEMGKGFSMRDSKDKAQRDGYSDINMEYVAAPMEALRNATTREQMIAAAKEVKSRRYLPYQNTTAKLDDFAKQNNLNIEYDVTSGGYIVKNKFGSIAYSSLRDFAASHMDANDIQQMKIAATVGVERMRRDNPNLSNRDIASALYDEDKKNTLMRKESAQKTFNEIEMEFNELDKKATLTPEEVLKKKNLAQSLEREKSNLETITKRMDEFGTGLDAATGNTKTLYSDYEKDPVGKAQSLAYEQFIDGWAKTYGSTHASRTLSLDPVWSKMQDINIEMYKEANKTSKEAKAGKEKEPTKEELRLAELNNPIYAGQNPDVDKNTVVRDVYSALVQGRNKSINSFNTLQKQTISNYLQTKGEMALAPSLVEDIFKKDVANPNALIDKETKEKLLTTAIFKGMDNTLGNMTWKQLYSNLWRDSMRNVQSILNDPFHPDHAAMTEAKLKMDVENANIANIDAQLNTGYAKLIKDNSALLNKDGQTLSREEYIDKKIREGGYTITQAPQSGMESLDVLGPMGSQLESARAVIKNGKQEDVSSLEKKFGEDYDRISKDITKYKDIIKKDPNIKRIVFSENYPMIAYAGDSEIKGEVAERIFDQIYNKSTFSGGLVTVANLDRLVSDAGLKLNDENRNMVLSKLQLFYDKGDQIDKVYPTNYVDESGKNPYQFYFKQKAIDDVMPKDADKKKDNKFERLAEAIKRNGVEIRYAGPTAADVVRENPLEKLFERDKQYKFKVDSEGKFGFGIQELTIPGQQTPSRRVTVDAWGVLKDKAGVPILQDGNYTFGKVEVPPIDIGLTTIDEAAEQIVAALQAYARAYKQDLERLKTK